MKFFLVFAVRSAAKLNNFHEVCKGFIKIF
jgi:hypothetical protein